VNNIYEYLNKFNIKYEEMEHKEIRKVEETNKIDSILNGIRCKNLLFKTNKDEFYLVIIEKNKQVDVKYLRKFLKVGKIHFANEEYLKELLGVRPGIVTPLGIINDINNKVKIIIDKDLINKDLLFLPLINTKTIKINYKDLIKFIKELNHEYVILE